jgi:hypothetical protein
MDVPTLYREETRTSLKEPMTVEFERCIYNLSNQNGLDLWGEEKG